MLVSGYSEAARCSSAHWHSLPTGYYSFSRLSGTYHMAEMFCRSVGGTVVEIGSELEYVLLTKEIGTLHLFQLPVVYIVRTYIHSIALNLLHVLSSRIIC